MRTTSCGESEGKIPLERRTRIWENNIKMDLRRNSVYGCGLD
jgi:hypothetical protein